MSKAKFAKPTLKRDKIIEVIQKDANGVGTLAQRANGRGPIKMCVMGGLLFACGMPKEELIGKTSPGSFERLKKGKDQWDVDAYEYGVEILIKAYGLTENEQNLLIDINDAYKTTGPRRKALIEMVKALRTKGEDDVFHTLTNR